MTNDLTRCLLVANVLDPAASLHDVLGDLTTLGASETSVPTPSQPGQSSGLARFECAVFSAPSERLPPTWLHPDRR